MEDYVGGGRPGDPVCGGLRHLGSGRRHQRGGPTTSVLRSLQLASALRSRSLRPCPSRVGGSTSRPGAKTPHGGQPDSLFFKGRHPLAGDVAGLSLILRENQHRCAGPATQAEEGLRHLVAGMGPRPPQHEAFRSRYQKGCGGRVPGGYELHGKSDTGSLPINPIRHHGGRELPHVGQVSLESWTGRVCIAPPSQAPRTYRTRGGHNPTERP